jgi:hypothetical protein
LTGLHHFARRLAGSLARARRGTALGLLLATGLAGCRHKAIRFVIPQGAQVPIELQETTPPDSSPEIATLPPPELPISPAEPPKPPPRRRPVPTPKEDTQPPTQVADAASVAVAIGTLSTDDAKPEVQQQTQELITSIRKRIAALPSKTAAGQKKQLGQVSHFLDEAQKALNSGDAEAAQNLAIKGRLLMDDLEKK